MLLEIDNIGFIEFVIGCLEIVMRLQIKQTWLLSNVRNNFKDNID